jgi:hypothetical protein
VQTDRTIPNNKLDIIIHGNEEETCVLMVAAISGDSNVTKRTENLKYKNLITEIRVQMEHKTKVIPVIIKATEKQCKLIQTIPEQRTRKAQKQGATKEAILGARTHAHTHTKLQKVQV